MNMLKKCRKAEIFNPAESLLCQAEVFSDISDRLWVSVSHDFPYEEFSYFNITFYDPVSGLVRCRCTLGSPESLSEERLSLLCTIVEVLESHHRRQDLKIPLEIEVELTCTYLPAGAPEPPSTFTAITRNISAGGIYLICEHPLPEDAEIRFEITEANKPLLLNAKVLRQDKLPLKREMPQYGHGCRFFDLKPQTESILRNYIFRKERQRQRRF